MESKGEVVIYKTDDGQTELKVFLNNDTVWLNQSQLTELFSQTKQNISLHIKNIFKEGELQESAVVKESLTTAADGKKYKTRLYNLDVIISTGYRIKSHRGTQFRIWATQTLKNHLVKGYTINEKRLQEQQEKFKELHQTVEFLKNTLGTKNLSGNEAQGLLEIISTYTRSFVLLNQFDSNSLEIELSDKLLTHEINYDEAIAAIEQLKKKLITEGEASYLFGKQREEAFSGILNSVVQTFGGEYLYPSIEEQAAHLLYFVIKNHPFADGNKRIGAFLFVWFLHLNQHLLRKGNEAKINDNALVALALLIAQSDPATKELMIKLVINLINE
ncbi:MAG: death-on-curing family protein [Flavisolibacter sp.]|jgi:prophage maintenance system killer protein|nr:death-on-curing family protein [Flavisolibacter sp.]